MAPTGSTDLAGARPDRLRVHAIDLYCRELCGSAQMSAAARDALDSVSPADAWGGDDALLRVTRTAAARHVPTKAAPHGWRGMLAAEHESDCNLTPSMLAQRANGELTPARQARLEEHLERCLFCRAAELREHRATRAFSAVIATGDPRGLRAAAPAALEETSPPPPPPAPAAEVTEISQPAEAVVLPEPAAPPERAAPPRRGLAVFPATAKATSSATPMSAAPAPSWRPAARRVRPAAHRGRAPGALTAYLPFFATLALGAVLVVVVALAVGGGAQARNAATSLPPPSAASTPPASVGIAPTRNAPKPQTHRTSRPASAPASTTATTTATTSTPVVQPSAAAAPANPTPSNPPAANPTPAANQPPRPSPTTASTPPSLVVSQQGTGLPTATAPTQTTIGGGNSTAP